MLFRRRLYRFFLAVRRYTIVTIRIARKTSFRSNSNSSSSSSNSSSRKIQMTASSVNEANTQHAGGYIHRTAVNRAWSSVILAVIIFLNSLVYFVCQTIASNCLAQVIAKFPFQVESFIPFKLRTTTVESAEKQSQEFTQSTTTSVEATTGG